jgi:ankyrin repeat protein
MEQINGQRPGFKNLANGVLSWIICAKRQMTAKELQHALALNLGNRELDKDNLAQIQHMVSVCAGLVTIDEESNIIRLAHHTTQEYFEGTWKTWFPNAQMDITNVCVTYLSFDVFEAGMCQSNEDFQVRLQNNVLYDYAALNWGRHVPTVLSGEKVIIDLLESPSKIRAASQAMLAIRSFYPSYSRSIHVDMAGVHVAAYFGLEGAIKGLLGNGCDVDLKDWREMTPLSWAAGCGQEAVVKLLLETGQVDVDSKDQLKQTPLSRAAGRGQEAIVKLLLETGQVDVDSKDWDGRTPLLTAAIGGKEAVVKLLLETGQVNVESKNLKGRTPLSWAAGHGHEAVVKLLLETGQVNVDSKDENEWTPLLWAAYSGQEAVVKLLLETGQVDIESKGSGGQTPLSWAAQNGHEAVVKLLQSHHKSS